MATSDWHDEYVLASYERDHGRAAQLAAAVRAGDLTRVLRGVYRRASDVEKDPIRRADDAFLARIRGVHLLAPHPPLFGGLSAAAAWTLPSVEDWPLRPLELVPPGHSLESTRKVRRSETGWPAPEVVRDGIRVTSLARTVVDVARTATFEQAVAMTDAALAGMKPTRWRTGRTPLSKSQLIGDLESLGSVRGRAKCRGVLEFAEGASGSAGESLSRVAIHRLRLPAPELQVAFHDDAGLIGYVDFFWRTQGIIGEFDGVGKYVREEFAGGRSTAQIVIDEKIREDRLRALGFTVVRWGWRDAREPALLRAKLARAGLL